MNGLLPDIREIQEQLAATLVALQRFDARLDRIAHHIPPPERTPAVTDEPADLPTQARELSDVIGALNRQVSTLNSRITRSERYTAALATLTGLIILVGAGKITVGYQVQKQTACQAQQNDAFRDSTLVARQARDRQDDQQLAQLDQQLALFATVLNPNATTTEQRNATLAYTKSVNASKQAILSAKQKRADNPLPTNSCS